MLLIIGLLLILLFFGLGFAVKVLWLGMILGIVLIVAQVVSGQRRL